MARMVSFAVLLVTLLVVAFLFYRVMAAFILPMFLAALFIVMFRPLHVWILGKCKGRESLAAGLTTLAILVIVLAPILFILYQAAGEGVRLAKLQLAQIAATTSGEQPPKMATSTEGSPAQDAETPALAPIDTDKLIVDIQNWLPVDVPREQLEQIVTDVRGRIVEIFEPLVYGGIRFVGSFLIGFVVMIVSLYYFLIDGPGMISTVMRLSPMDDRHEQQLLDQFGQLSRAVVIATLLSAVVQGLLAGIGFWFVEFDSVFLLMALTMLLAMVPFVGAAAVWVPSCLFLLLHDDRMGAAIGLAVYGTLIISMADNVIKPLVLHGRSNLHPLLALLSVLGGVQALGPIGILVGPMVVAFLQTLLKMLQTELTSMDQTEKERGVLE